MNFINNQNLMGNLKIQENFRDLGLSVILQISFGTIFVMFSIGLIVFKNASMENDYFMFILIGLIMLLLMPLIYFPGKHYIGSKIEKLNIKPLAEPLNVKFFLLVILVIWILDKIEFRNLLKDFTQGNEVASIFLVAIVLMAFFLHKTNLIIEASIFVLGVILFHILEAQITLIYLVVFYLFMGVIFLTGGILDFRKFSKLSASS